MDEDTAPTPARYALWHLPTGTCLLAGATRQEALHLLTTLLAEGTPPDDLRLQCEVADEHPEPPVTTSPPRVMLPKWR